MREKSTNMPNTVNKTHIYITLHTSLFILSQLTWVQQEKFVIMQDSNLVQRAVKYRTLCVFALKTVCAGVVFALSRLRVTPPR